MTRIYSNELKEGIIYSAPLFFDDGVNMFLAKRRSIKKYHIDILKKWSIPFIITYGTVIDDENAALHHEDGTELEEIEPLEEELMELQEEEEKKKHMPATFSVQYLNRIVQNFSKNRSYVLKKIRSLEESLKQIFISIQKGETVARTEVESITESLTELVKDFPSETLNIIISMNFDSTYEIKAIIASIIGILIAKNLDMQKKDRANLLVASLLHDIGMRGVSKDITEKQTKLTRQEFELLKLHLLKSARLTSEHLYYPKEVGEIIMQHHERFDGSGYPEGLEGEAIHLSARVLSLTDSFSAMICRTGYGKPLSGYETMKELSQRSDKKFDPKILKSFIAILGYYPVGSYVLLNSKHFALVIEANEIFPYQPRVQILSKSSEDDAKINIGDIINLQDYPQLSIVSQIQNAEA
jgi:HD-GYP domain-containing protein (c-di-GMP phosphodiesterase class II)